MRTAERYSFQGDRPVRLTEEERNNLYTVFDDFFSCYQLQDIRKILWDWLIAAISSDADEFKTGYSRSNLVYTYEKLELLIEAAHELRRRHKKKQARYRSNS